MGKTCKLGNRNVILALMILAAIVVGITGYLFVYSDMITYVFIEQTEDQMGVSLQNENGISWLATAYRWLCCGISLLFLVIRFCQNIKLRNKSAEELIMSYPMGRKQIMIKEIMVFGYGIVLSVLALLIAGVFMGMEAIKVNEIGHLFEKANVVMSHNQTIILWCMEKISLLILFIAWHYLCEIVCVERMVGFFLGAIGIAIYNIYFFAYDMELVVSIPYGKESVVSSIITILVLMLLAMLLFQICIWLYQKIDYSKSGWFYFNLPKYFFIACVCLLPISAVTANMVALELPSIGLLLLSIGLVLAFNYLAASHNQRKNVGKILLESGKTIVVGCALVFVVLNYEPILCAVEYLLWVNTDAVDGQWETYESTEFVDWVQDEYKGEQACKDGLAEIRNQGIETLIPDEMEQWKFREAIVNWTVRGTSPEKKYDGYAMRLGNDNKDRVFLYCTRMNDKAKPNQIMSCIEGLRVIKDEEYGTLIVTSYTADDKTQFISFCQYYEGKEYYDSYTVTGEVPEEELLTIVHSLK